MKESLARLVHRSVDKVVNWFDGSSGLMTLGFQNFHGVLPVVIAADAEQYFSTSFFTSCSTSSDNSSICLEWVLAVLRLMDLIYWSWIRY